MASSWGLHWGMVGFLQVGAYCSLQAYCYHNQNQGQMLPDFLFFLCISQSFVTENRNYSSYFKHKGQRASNRELGAYGVLRLGFQDSLPEEQWRTRPQGSCQLCWSEIWEIRKFPLHHNSTNNVEIRKLLMLLLLGAKLHLLGPYRPQK